MCVGVFHLLWDFLCSIINREIIVLAPLRPISDLLSVHCLISVCDAVQNGCVINKLEIDAIQAIQGVLEYRRGRRIHPCVAPVCSKLLILTTWDLSIRQSIIQLPMVVLKLRSLSFMMSWVETLP